MKNNNKIYGTKPEYIKKQHNINENATQYTMKVRRYIKKQFNI